MDKDKPKKSRKDRQKALRNDGIPRGCGINYSQVKDRHVDDVRFERQKAAAAAGLEANEDPVNNPMPSTHDALFRMQAGLEARTLSQKINDPHRPTWEQYKKENEDKLDLVGQEMRKMAQYRMELDAERERKLASMQTKVVQQGIVDSDEEQENGSGSQSSKKKRKKKGKDKSKKSKKEKSSKKSKKRSRSHGSDSEESHDDDGDGEGTKSKRRKHKGSESESFESSPGPVRLSEFLREQNSDDHEEGQVHNSGSIEEAVT